MTLSDHEKKMRREGARVGVHAIAKKNIALPKPPSASDKRPIFKTSLARA